MSSGYTQYAAIVGHQNPLALGIPTGEAGNITNTVITGVTNILGDLEDDTFSFGRGTYVFAGTTSLNLRGGGTTQGFVGTMSGTTYIFAPSGLSLDTNVALVVTPPGTAGSGECNLSTCSIGCFMAGTRLKTPDGERPVESLRPGDLLTTAEGGHLPLRWLGRSEICLFGTAPLDLLPIRITAGALGTACPREDLLVSCGHALMLGGVLVQAGALVNGETIVREYEAPPMFTYFHVELDTHAVVLAEGAPVESFLAGGKEFDFANWADRVGPAQARALPYPRVTSPRQLPRAVQAQIARAAEALECEMAL